MRAWRCLLPLPHACHDAWDGHLARGADDRLWLYRLSFGRPAEQADPRFGGGPGQRGDPTARHRYGDADPGAAGGTAGLTPHYTHFHADHVSGLDDVKAFNAVLGGPMPCFGNASTERSLRERYRFAFEPVPFVGAIPQLRYQVTDEPFRLFGLDLVPAPIQHGQDRGLWLARGRHRLSDRYQRYSGQLETPAAGARTHGRRRTALSSAPDPLLDSEAARGIAELRPRRALLTHVNHDLDQATVEAELPDGVRLAYDGLVVEL